MLFTSLLLNILLAGLALTTVVPQPGSGIIPKKHTKPGCPSTDLIETYVDVRIEIATQLNSIVDGCGRNRADLVVIALEKISTHFKTLKHHVTQSVNVEVGIVVIFGKHVVELIVFLQSITQIITKKDEVRQKCHHQLSTISSHLTVILQFLVAAQVDIRSVISGLIGVQLDLNLIAAIGLDISLLG